MGYGHSTIAIETIKAIKAELLTDKSAWAVRRISERYEVSMQTVRNIRSGASHARIDPAIFEDLEDSSFPPDFKALKIAALRHAIWMLREPKSVHRFALELGLKDAFTPDADRNLRADVAFTQHEYYIVIERLQSAIDDLEKHDVPYGISTLAKMVNLPPETKIRELGFPNVAANKLSHRGIETLGLLQARGDATIFAMRDLNKHMTTAMQDALVGLIRKQGEE